MTTLTTVAGSDEVDPCPSRGVASGEREITGAAPRVRAWSRGECGTEWAFTVATRRTATWITSPRVRTRGAAGDRHCG